MKSTNLPQWKIRRLASRSLRVLDRHQDKSPALAAFNITLRPAAEACVASVDALRGSSVRRQTEYKEGKRAVSELVRALRTWAGQIAALGVIEGFNAGDYGDNPAVPDDVISDAEVFVGTVISHTEVNPDHVPFLDALLSDLNQRIAFAQKEWLEAEQEQTKHNALSVEVSSSSRTFMNHLITFRRALAAEIGRTHPDFRAIRSARINRELPEDPSPAFPTDEVSEGLEDQLDEVASDNPEPAGSGDDSEESESNAA